VEVDDDFEKVIYEGERVIVAGKRKAGRQLLSKFTDRGCAQWMAQK